MTKHYVSGFDDGAKAYRQDILKWKIWFGMMVVIALFQALLIWWIIHA